MEFKTKYFDHLVNRKLVKFFEEGRNPEAMKLFLDGKTVVVKRPLSWSNIVLCSEVENLIALGRLSSYELEYCMWKMDYYPAFAYCDIKDKRRIL